MPAAQQYEVTATVTFKVSAAVDEHDFVVSRVQELLMQLKPGPVAVKPRAARITEARITGISSQYAN